MSQVASRGAVGTPEAEENALFNPGHPSYLGICPAELQFTR
jgi:hypothetical protein